MLARWLLRLRALFRREDVEAEFDEELRFHLERETEQNLARGMSPDEARRAARRALGDPGRLKEEARETWRWRWLDELLQDLRYGARRLRRNPLFTAVAGLSLGFGIGVTSTLFGVVDALDFRPLPYPDAERLVWLAELLPPDSERCPGCPWVTSPSTAAEWRARARSYEAMGFWSRSSAYSRRGDAVQSATVGHATPGFFELLGLRLRLGRGFVPDDTLESSEPVAILSHATWQRVFDGDPDVLGKRLEYFGDRTLADARSATVVGVLPEDFRFDGRTYAFWIPAPGGGGVPGIRFATVLGRLKPGVSPAAARAELGAIARGLSASDPDPRRDVTVRPLRERLSAGTGEGRWMLFGVTALVLLVAVMNVAGLSLARTLARRGELAVRRTLGAPRLRLVRQLLVEGVLLGLIGGGVGVLLTIWGARAARTWFRVEGSATSLELDHRIFLFAAGLSVMVGVLTALLPALRTRRAALHVALRKGAGTATTSGTGFLTGALLTAQVAAGLVLVTGAGLLGSEFLEVRYLDLGFDPEGLYEVTLFGGEELREEPEAWRAEVEQARVRTRTVRGVSGAALRHVSALNPSVVRPDGRREIPTGESEARVHAVGRAYFETLGTPLLRGRGFTAADRRGERPVAVLNQAAAGRFWPGEESLGRQVFVGDSEGVGEWLTVVGVSADAERGEMVERHWPIVFRPLAQAPLYHPAVTLYVRLTRPSETVLSTVQSTLRRTLGHAASEIRPVEEELAQRFRAQRFNALALNLFAAFALLLAAMGIYGSVAYAVTRRTRELGIRVALGAGKRRVLRLVAGRATLVTVAGVVLGFLASAALVRLLGGFVAAISVTNPWIFATSALVMGVVAFVAAYVPARRATRVDPAITLRSE